MSNDRIFDQIKAVSAAVLSSEDGIDVGLSATLRMAAEALDAHRAVELPSYVVQPALDHMFEALLRQVESRRQIALAHLEFGRTAARLGATPTSYGDLWPCPKFPTEPSSDNVHRIGAVA